MPIIAWTPTRDAVAAKLPTTTGLIAGAGAEVLARLNYAGGQYSAIVDALAPWFTVGTPAVAARLAAVTEAGQLVHHYLPTEPLPPFDPTTGAPWPALLAKATGQAGPLGDGILAAARRKLEEVYATPPARLWCVLVNVYANGVVLPHDARVSSLRSNPYGIASLAALYSLPVADVTDVANGLIAVTAQGRVPQREEELVSPMADAAEWLALVS